VTAYFTTLLHCSSSSSFTKYPAAAWPACQTGMARSTTKARSQGSHTQDMRGVASSAVDATGPGKGGPEGPHALYGRWVRAEPQEGGGLLGQLGSMVMHTTDLG
jgi:hypothetical protein